MYTIAFDETTNFETLRNQRTTTEPALIAGIVYKDNSDTEYKMGGKKVNPENVRIINYYKKVCSTVGTAFPNDLHVDNNGGNSEKVKKTKREVNRTIGEFIKYGTYGGQELLFSDIDNTIANNGDRPLKREGSYQIVVLFRAPEFSTNTVENKILRDDIASNLYLNMVQEFLKKGIFLNLSITESSPEVAFNIPKRLLPVSMVQEQSKEDYSRLGYGTHIKHINDGKDVHSYEIGDDGYYHALITEFCNYRSIIVKDLFTKSITYKLKQEEKQAFLFLSDSICSYLSFKNTTHYDQDIRKRMNEINNPENNLFFYYEQRDDHYDKAARAYISNDYFTALSEVYEGKRSANRVIKEYYRKKWYLLIEKKIQRSNDLNALKSAIEKLDKYRYSDNLDQSKLLYIMTAIENGINNTRLDSKEKFLLADIGISAHTHIGNPQMAAHYYEECMKYKNDVDGDEIQRAQIRYITTLNDLLKFEKARDHALGLFGIETGKESNETEKRKGFILRIIDKLLSRESDNDQEQLNNDHIFTLLPVNVSRPNMYKTLSSLGQAYAFLNDPMAERCFTKAIQDINNQANSNITMSFLLHWYIENGDEANYQLSALKYFDGHVNLEDQLSYLIKEGTKSREESPAFSIGYAMFVYIKAFYVFYKDKPEYKEVTNKLIHLKDTIRSMVPDADSFMRNHPWELIFKYASLLAGYNNDKKMISENKKAAKAAIGRQSESIIRKVMDYGDIELLAHELNNDRAIQNYNRKINLLWNELLEEGAISDRNPDEMSVDEKLNDLQHLFTYMYH